MGEPAPFQPMPAREEPQPVQHQQPECPLPPPPQPERKPSPPPCRQGGSAGDFLRQLLPKNLDTGDLLIVLLLLLMAGDCKEEQNTALLTLALYLFM